MAASKVIEVSFGRSSVALVRVNTAYFYNSGIIFKPTDIELPTSYQVHWADSPDKATTFETIGTAEGAPIPDDLWNRSRVIYGWIYLHPTEDSGITGYEVRIYKNVRAGLPDGTEPTPAEQSTIDQLISALNGAVEQAEDAQEAIENMSVSATTLAEGSSATVTKSEQDGVVHLEFGIPKGATGDDGYSPTANVSKSGKTSTITITDKNGTTSAQVEDGEDGIDGISPSVSVTDITGGHRVVITDKDGTKSFDVEDGATGATPNLTIGTVTTLEPDASATATITGTAEDPVLNLGIPRGQTGEVTEEEFTQLKEDLTDKTILADTVVETVSYIYDLTYTNNAMNDTTGEQSIASPKRASTPDMYYIPPACKLYASYDLNSQTVVIYCYNENREFIRTVNNAYISNNMVALPNGTRYLRFFMFNRDDSDITPADAKAYATYKSVYVGRIKDIHDMVKSLYAVGKNVLDPSKTTVGYISNYLGSIATNQSYLTSDFIPISAGQSITVSPKCRKFLFYDGIKNGVQSTYLNDGTNSAYTFTATENGFVRVSYLAGASEQVEYGYSATTYEAFKISNAEGIDFSESQKAYIESVVDPIESAVEDVEESFEEVKTDVVASTTVAKTDDNSGYYNQNGYYTASTTYFYSDLIPAQSGDKIYAEKSNGTSARLRYVASYDSNQTALSGKGWDNGASSYDWFTVPDGVSYVRVTLYASTGTTQIVKVRTVNAESTFYAKTRFQSVLESKKMVFCGDSFTQGDFSGLQATDFQFQNGKYVGKKKVYPFFIGLRTGAEIVNEAISGSTMAYVDGNRSEFSTPNGRYTQIPSDADYITLYFGINDSHQNVPIGEITDNTNTTFYGAWNIVMQYLIANHPDAKIGIIISNGCDTIDYPNAEIAIAKKYGVAFLDMNSDYKVPILFRVNGKPETDASIIQANYEHYRVSSTNGHPNVAMHEYESTIIQHWLEGI